MEWVIDPKDTGSLIAMTFDEFGQIIASRENGPLILIRDENKDGLLDTVTTLCDQVKNCQGILAVSGRVFVIGEGPQGTALYRLSDEDRDGRIDNVEPLLKFTGEMGEHGPHALTLGPDGLIYMVAGNFTRPDRPFESSSPLPARLRRRSDPAPLRRRQRPCGGSQSARRHDLAHRRQRRRRSSCSPAACKIPTTSPSIATANCSPPTPTWNGTLGMPWYRPTRVNHVVPGAEFGWRSGWAKWPDYFYDNLPPMAETGRGSPTGIEVYNHLMFPQRFHNSLFVCDWSRGRILAVAHEAARRVVRGYRAKRSWKGSR